MKARKAKALLLDKNIVGIEAAELFQHIYSNTFNVAHAMASTEIFLSERRVQLKIYNYSVHQTDGSVVISIQPTLTSEITQLRVTIP